GERSGAVRDGPGGTTRAGCAAHPAVAPRPAGAPRASAPSRPAAPRRPGSSGSNSWCSFGGSCAEVQSGRGQTLPVAYNLTDVVRPGCRPRRDATRRPADGTTARGWGLSENAALTVPSGGAAIALVQQVIERWHELRDR